ncbi:MAG: glutaminase A [Acidobacteriota bacterium]
MKSAASPARQILRELHARYQPLTEGRVADYIPELAKADPEWFGISLVTVDGKIVEVGDTSQRFTIQSISKPFVYGLALEHHGRDHVLTKVGVEPSGDAFNSIIFDERSNRPFNPMVNAGAIATAGLLPGKDLTDRVNLLLDMFRRYTGSHVHIDPAVFLSERSTGHRNRAIGHLMLNFGMIGERVEETLELYFQQCSVLVNCHELAMMAATLANQGVHPQTGQRAVAEEYVKDILAVMYTCGMYDFAGEWAYSVGLPAKSGVSGGILAVVPGRMGVAVFSPRLDPRGNSVRGIRVFQELSREFGLHIFGPESSRNSLQI